MAKKRVLVLTGGGDCPGLNAVIRAVTVRAIQSDWEVIGSIQSYNSLLWDPMEYVVLDAQMVRGIHVKGGTILETVNRGGPFSWPTKRDDGTWYGVDRSDELIERINSLGIEAVISIGGDGSMKIASQLAEKGLNVVGVPKTIDNDLSSTDFTFGFQTAVEIATESVDKLVTTAASHSRILIMEVMGRYAGWIALHAAIAGGADICLIPEIPYKLSKVIEKIESRFTNKRGFAIVVVAEGATEEEGTMVAGKSNEIGYENPKLGGISIKLEQDLKNAGVIHDIRVTIPGHLQRGGRPYAYDRILATQFGVKAFEMVLDKEYGRMVAYRHPDMISVPIEEAISKYNLIDVEKSFLVKTARGLNISLGD